MISNTPSVSRIENVIKLKAVTLDDIASVRYVHKTSFQILAGAKHSEEEINAHVSLIYSSEYIDKILSSNMYCAWIGEEIVGTAGWCPADDNGKTARIRQVFIRPLFHSMGIGRLLMETTEERAKQAGFQNFSVQANINAVPFYKRLGYSISSHGVMSTPDKVDLPVAFMRKSGKAKAPVLQQKSYLKTTEFEIRAA